MAGIAMHCMGHHMYTQDCNRTHTRGHAQACGPLGVGSPPKASITIRIPPLKKNILISNLTLYPIYKKFFVCRVALISTLNYTRGGGRE